MDGQRFDHLTLRLASRFSRRRFGHMLAMSGLGVCLGMAAETGAKKKKKKKKCKNGKKKCGKACVETKTNVSHCGGCNRPCGAGIACQDGACSESCASPNTDCNGECVNTQTSNAHCGSCSNTCQGALICLSGTCGCDSGSPCGTACVDHQTDGANCGECGINCGEGECQSGECQPPPPTCGSGGECRVFATSLTYPGNLGGLTGADQTCNYHAQAAGLPGAYKAWLADPTGSPSSRFVQSTGPYMLVTGDRIADDWADLTDDDPDYELDHQIDRDENGNVIAGDQLYRYVWTNTKPDGTLGFSDQLHCLNWLTSDQFASLGGAGNVYYTDSYWTDASSFYCNARRHLYCFQQS